MPDLHYVGGVDDYATWAGHERNPYHSYKFEGNILVNPRGKRYVQEDAEWGYVIHTSVEEVTKHGCNIDKLDKHNHIICDADHLWVWENGGITVVDNGDGTISGDFWGIPLPTHMYRADTLEELAEMIGVPAENLVKTVEEWNSYRDNEYDPDFGRRVDFGKIQTPPFYADIIRPDVLGSMSGLRCDIETRVLDVNGQPIPGLYSAGTNMAGNWVGPFYPGCGWAILGTIVWGRKAGANIAASESWD